MRRRLAVALTGIALMSGPVLIASPAEAATVPNMFWRTCSWFGCSSYVQSNGVYRSNIISVCYTKNIWGRVTSSYYHWGRC